MLLHFSHSWSTRLMIKHHPLPMECDAMRSRAVPGVVLSKPHPMATNGGRGVQTPWTTTCGAPLPEPTTLGCTTSRASLSRLHTGAVCRSPVRPPLRLAGRRFAHDLVLGAARPERQIVRRWDNVLHLARFRIRPTCTQCVGRTKGRNGRANVMDHRRASSASPRCTCLPCTSGSPRRPPHTSTRARSGRLCSKCRRLQGDSTFSISPVCLD
eukprot:SAG31_NODE_948_length_10825_cov_9.412829_8_plen_212_part_00